MRRPVARAAAALLLFAGPSIFTAAARAAPVQFALEPGTVTLTFRAWGLGLITIDGHFTRFHGTLTLDDANPAACTLSVLADAASLAMPSASMTADALGPDMLDVTHYPDFRLQGSCAGPTLKANLLLHGVDRPVVLDVTTTGGAWTASGLMRRAEWGMGARPLLAGPQVRIALTAGLPPRMSAPRS
jgi:polyisoprenoid-binding protein YceI